MGMRPCKCDNVTSEVWSQDQCRRCWLYRYDERCRVKWSPITVGSAPPRVKQLPPATCQHLGPELRREQCKSCGGKIMVKVFACQIHGQSQGQSKKIKGVASCRDCPDYKENEDGIPLGP